MSSARRGTLLAAVVGLAVVLVYLALWYEVSPRLIGRSDFTSTYVGATLLREGHGAAMYDQALQAPLHASLIAPDREGNLPFVNPPLAAALALPVSLIGLQGAYRLWSIIQFALLVISVWVAIRGSPAWRGLPRLTLAAIGLAALASLGTGATLLLGQWDGVSALGLAVAYLNLRRGRPATAGAVLAVSSLIAKPHLALGLAAFLLGWRDRRLIGGAVAGLLAAGIASLLVAGPGGVGGFVGAAFHSTTRWQLANMVSLVGIGGAIAGNGTAAHLVAGVAELAALAVAAALGSLVRSRPARLEAALAGAAVLSLLASPHAYWDDLALLVPAAAWSLTVLVARPAGSGSLTTAAIAVWVAISLAGYLDIVTSAAVPLGLLTPWALIAAAALAVAVCRHQQPEAPPTATITAGGGVVVSATLPAPTTAPRAKPCAAPNRARRLMLAGRRAAGRGVTR